MDDKTLERAEIVAALRHCPVAECARCDFSGENDAECKLGERAAALIESLAAELDATCKHICDQCGILPCLKAGCHWWRGPQGAGEGEA